MSSVQKNRDDQKFSDHLSKQLVKGAKSSQKKSPKSSGKPRKKKSPKGTVSVESDNGWLRLRLTYDRERFARALGLPDSKANWIIAQDLANRIWKDIDSGNFDESLEKYGLQRSRKAKSSPKLMESSIDLLTVVDLFIKFMEYKAKEVTLKTMEKYQATLNYLKRHFSNVAVKALDENSVDKFVKAQSQKRLSKNQIKRRLEELAAAWRWHDGESNNPWQKAAGRIKVPPKQKPKPFSKKEMEAILQAFRNSEYYAWYADLVEFLFRTGCRTGEAICLRWRHLSEDCSSVWIGEVWSRGKQCPVKMGKDRNFALPPTVQKLLLSRKKSNSKPDDLVFPSPRGLGINDHNFSQRAWRKMLEKAKVPYRNFYNTRHTHISLALMNRAIPITLSAATGHDV